MKFGPSYGLKLNKLNLQPGRDPNKWTQKIEFHLHFVHRIHDVDTAWGDEPRQIATVHNKSIQNKKPYKKAAAADINSSLPPIFLFVLPASR